MPYPSSRLTAPQMPRPAPRAMTSVWSTWIAELKNSIQKPGAVPRTRRRLPAQPRPPFNVLLKAAVLSWASSGLVVGLVYLVHVVFLVSLELESAGHILFHVKGVALVGVGEVFVVGMLRYVVLIRQKRAQAADLEDALAAVEGGKVVHAHELAPELLVVQAVRRLTAPALAGVVVE